MITEFFSETTAETVTGLSRMVLVAGPCEDEIYEALLNMSSRASDKGDNKEWVNNASFHHDCQKESDKPRKFTLGIEVLKRAPELSERLQEILIKVYGNEGEVYLPNTTFFGDLLIIQRPGKLFPIYKFNKIIGLAIFLEHALTLPEGSIIFVPYIENIIPMKNVNLFFEEANKISKERNIQIIASTDSWEVIKGFVSIIPDHDEYIKNPDYSYFHISEMGAVTRTSGIGLKSLVDSEIEVRW